MRYPSIISSVVASAVLISSGAPVYAQTAETAQVQPALVPAPVAVSDLGGAYTFPSDVAIGASTTEERAVASFAVSFFRTRHSASHVISGGSAQLRLKIAPAQNIPLAEGYTLSVGARGADIS